LLTIDDPSEAERLHNRLMRRRAGDVLSEVFDYRLHHAVQEEMLRTLRGIFRPGQEVVEAAESFPSVSFGHFRSTLSLNPQYWVVKYILRLKEGQPIMFSWERRPIVFSSDPQQRAVPRELDPREEISWRERVTVPFQTNEVMSRNPDVQWTSRYRPPTIEITIGNYGPEAALNDLWYTPESRNYYALECWIAAVLAQLHGIYLFYLSEGRVDEFNREYQSFWIEISERGNDTSLAYRGLRLFAGPAELSHVPPASLRIPLRDLARQRVFWPGTWVTLRNPFLTGSWANENAVYLGGDRFWGFPIGNFTPETYAEYLYKNTMDPRDPRKNFIKDGVEFPFELGRPWDRVRGKVVDYVREHVEMIPRGHPRVVFPSAHRPTR
jgi:hypothetical protein